MSPEQAEGKKVDARSDIFSFGSVLYEMVTGRRAFQGETRMSTLSAILSKEPAPLAEGTPPELERIIARCLRKDPERRYQSITDVKLALQEVQSESGAADVPLVVRTAKGRWIVAAAMVVAAAGAWYAFPRGSQSQMPVVVTPLTMFSGVAQEPAVSPDGKMVAFAWDGDRGNMPNIYVKVIGGGEPLQLTWDHAWDVSPVWSPDGRSIAFTHASRDFTRLKAPVMIVPELGGVARMVGSGMVQDWSPDGSTLLVTKGDTDEASGHFLVSLRDGGSRRLTTSPPGFALSYARFSPDGRSVYYVEGSSGRSRMFQIPVEGGTPKPLLTEFQGIGKFGWIGSGREMILTGLLHEVGGFYRVPVSGGPARLLPFGAGGQVATSRFGSTAVFVKSESASGIWRVGAWPGMDRNPQPWGTNGAANWTPVFSRDGNRAAFASSRSGRWQIYTSQADGREEVAIPRFAGGETGPVGSPVFSPDGNQVAFDCDIHAGRTRGICVASTPGGAPRVLTTVGTSDYVPEWSPDGQWIYFTSERNGFSTIWRIPAAGGTAQQITKGGGYTAKISPDGKYLYYLKSQREGELWRAPVEGGVEERILPEFKNRNFWLLPDGIYLLDSGNADSFMRRRAKARFYRFRTKQVEDLGFETEKPVIGHGVCLSPDGKWLLYTQEDHASANLMLVENFR
jgi:Tol biopolymer transport system component